MSPSAVGAALGHVARGAARVGQARVGWPSIREKATLSGAFYHPLMTYDSGILTSWPLRKKNNFRKNSMRHPPALSWGGAPFGKNLVF